MSGHAMITGGGSGIGRALALALADAGWRVTIVGRNSERLALVCAERPGTFSLTCDVGDEAAVVRAVVEAISHHGPIAALINCAGIAPTAAFEKTGADIWDMVWRTNVMGAVNATRAALPGMRALPTGRIVNIASTAALKGYATAALKGYAYVSAYTASKHALLGMTRALAVELAGTAITANAVCPGYADTPIIQESVDTIVAKTGRTRDQALATFTGSNPQGRLIDPAEVAETVLWLLSEGARSVTGQAIVVAGGEIM
jgi:NAD(P)-dependent dehydrogenase (short-subunit alcohol dehydrogenase family)